MNNKFFKNLLVCTSALLLSGEICSMKQSGRGISVKPGPGSSAKKPSAASPAGQTAAIAPAQQKQLDTLLQNMGNAQIKVFAHDDVYKKPIDTATWDQLINKIKDFVFTNAEKSDQQQLTTMGLNPIIKQNTYLVDAVSGAQKAFATNTMDQTKFNQFSSTLNTTAAKAAEAERNLRNAGFQSSGSQLAQTALQNLSVYIQDIAKEANKQLSAKFNASSGAKAAGAKSTARTSTRSPASKKTR